MKGGGRVVEGRWEGIERAMGDEGWWKGGGRALEGRFVHVCCPCAWCVQVTVDVKYAYTGLCWCWCEGQWKGGGTAVEGWRKGSVRVAEGQWNGRQRRGGQDAQVYGCTSTYALVDGALTVCGCLLV
jgi:hypothetical protein